MFDSIMCIPPCFATNGCTVTNGLGPAAVPTIHHDDHPHEVLLRQRLAALSGVPDVREILPDWQPLQHLPARFVACAGQFSDAVAVEFWATPAGPPQCLTYRQLREQAQALAHRLAPRVASESVVVLHLPHGLDLLVAFLGGTLSGAAVACVDVTLPPAKLAFIVEDTAAAALLTHRALHADDPPRSRPDMFTIFLDDPLEAPLAVDSAGLPVVADGSLAYVIYTSGSTGNPKGVCLEHGAVANYAAIEQGLLRVRPGDRVLQMQSMSFVAGPFDCWRAWLGGATLVHCAKEFKRLGPDLVPFMERARVTMFKATPTILRMMRDLRAGPAEDRLPDLRVFISSGEALTEEIVEDFVGPHHLLLNTYGPTETCSNITVGVCVPGKPITIGYPMPTFTIHVLDPVSLAPAERGELCASGKSLARGYLNLPAPTAHAFFAHPTLGPLYRTGDLVERAGDQLLYVGRMDFQVKLHGFRVELGGVEAHLLALPGVEKAACTCQDGRIVAYLELRKGLDPAAVADLRLPNIARRLEEQGLPAYAMPGVVLHLDDFPFTVSFKLDRLQLPKVAIRTASSASLSSMASLEPATPPSAASARQGFPGTPGTSLQSSGSFRGMDPPSTPLSGTFQREYSLEQLADTYSLEEQGLLRCIVHAFAQSLDVHTIPLETDYFAVGGDAKTAQHAARLLSTEPGFGAVTAETIAQCPTAARLCEWVLRQDAD